MVIEARDCRTVISEIASTLQDIRPGSLSAATLEHLSMCSRCRAGLLLLIRGFDPEPMRLETSDACEPCLADLAAFIDLEADDPVQAAMAYPHVWWHLWTCNTCSQTYEFTQILLEARRVGHLPPLQLLRKTTQSAAPVIQRVRLTRQALSLALPKQLTVLRGADDQYILFDDAEDEPERRQFTIVAQEQADGFWEMIVTVEPSPAGLVVLTSGKARFASPIGPSGTATISGIPSDMLINPDSPGLEISIVPTEEH